MSAGPSITNANDQRLIEYIRSARHRLVYVAPGVSDEVATTLVDRWRALGRDAAQVVLDADAEVCRLGYGTINGLKRLQDEARNLGGFIAEQPGVRIGLVIADERTLIYSPTPLLLEAPSGAPQRPNAIELGEPPPAVLRDMGLGPSGVREKIVGLDPIQPAKVQNAERDLEKAPPARFDLARQVRVYTNYFQFVDLEMPGCSISRRKVRIPAGLVGLARQAGVEDRFHAQYDIVQEEQLSVRTADDRTITEKSLSETRNRIKKDFLFDLTGYGTVVRRENKKEFEDAVEQLRRDVKTFSNGVGTQLQEQIDAGRAALVEALLPAVETNPPARYVKLHGKNPAPDVIRRCLEEDLRKAFGTADALVSRMEVKLVFKDVAYESLHDEEFLKVARETLGDIDLHTEFGAAGERREFR